MDISQLLTTENTIFILGVLGMIFTVYNYFRNPQINSEKTDALITQRMDNMAKDISRLEEMIKIHSTQIDYMIKAIERIGTIIEERIPRGVSLLKP